MSIDAYGQPEPNKLHEKDSKDTQIQTHDDRTTVLFQQANVVIELEADQKTVKPKIKINNLATRGQIDKAVLNISYAWITLNKQMEAKANQALAPLPTAESSIDISKSKKKMQFSDEDKAKE